MPLDGAFGYLRDLHFVLGYGLRIAPLSDDERISCIPAALALGRGQRTVQNNRGSFFIWSCPYSIF